MKTRLLLFIFIFFGYHMSKAQNLPDIVPPSPEAASLIKHSQMDVSLYTGTPNIGVPFHTISYKGVNVPVGISYNSGGIKVGDIASWAGLGWNLNAGGLVSRSIRGIPDDAGTFGYMYTSYTVEALILGDADYRGFQLDIDVANQRDYEPDIFNFSFPGGSGQFFYDQTLDKFVQTPYSNLKIETKTNNNKIEGFIITDTQGVAYHFGKSSNNLRSGLEALSVVKSKRRTWNGIFESDPDAYGDAINPYYQTWMLMDIIFPTSSESIAFTYSTETNVKTTQLQNEEYIKPVATQSGCDADQYSEYYIYKEFAQPKVSSITFPEGKIIFEKNNNTERLDLKNSYPLEKIKLLDDDDQLVKGMELHTSYFTSAVNENSFFDTQNEGLYRLKLDSISQFGKNLNTLPPYKFEYDSKILPSRFSRSQDYFGYYNGENNTTLIPKGTYGLPGYVGDAIRSVDPAFTDACVLEKITYPIGGYDQFIWENNKIQYVGVANNYRDYLLDHQLYVFNDPLLFSDPDPNIDFSSTFTIPADSDGVVEFNVAMTGCPIPNQFNSTSCDFSLKIVGVTNPGYLLTILNASFYATLPAGTYKLIAEASNPGACNPHTDPSCSNPESFSAQLKWTSDPTPGEYMYGGLRIAEIKSYETPVNLALHRNFSYNSFVGNTNLSSGQTLNFIDLSMDNYRVICYWVPIPGLPVTQIDTDYTLKISSNSLSQMVATKGNLVGYTNVTESYSGITDHGKKEYTFSMTNLAGSNPYGNLFGGTFPSNFATPLEADWRNGSLEAIKYFDSSDNLLKNESYAYESVNSVYRDYFGLQLLRMKPANNTASSDNFYATTYNYVTEWYRLKSTTTTDYFNGTPVVTTQTHTYDNNSLLASESKTTSSDGESIITKTFYPDDVISVSDLGADDLTPDEKAAIDKLKSTGTGQHRIAEAVQTETYKDEDEDGIADSGELLSRQRTNYKEWQWPNNFILPEYVQTATGNNTLENRIQFLSYYNNGNVKEVKKTDGTTLVYIWGYNEQYPIAKIENATYAQVSGQVANLHNKSNLDDDRCLDSGSCDEKNLRTALTTLRNAVPDAMVTTYTYDPLTGVTSITDPKGYIMYYEYDEFNRLERVVDADGKILSENEYYYKNQ